MIKMVRSADLKKTEMMPFDLFISFCSFEKRCLCIAKNINGELIKKALVFVNSEAPRETMENLEIINRLLNYKADIHTIDLFNPIALADALLDIIIGKTEGLNKPHILIDVTAFTHEALLMMMAIADRFLTNAQIEYAYCNASTYASESGRDGEKWLSRGIRDVRSVLGFAGDIKPSLDTVLIMMVGYECERAWHVIDTISPEELIITFNDAIGSTDQTNGDANKHHADLLKDLAAYYQNPIQYVIPSNNPFETAKKLEEVINTISEDKNIIIAPMNNKLATVGAGLVSLKRRDIQLCYAPAVYYNTSSYSVEGDECYLFALEE